MSEDLPEISIAAPQIPEALRPLSLIERVFTVIKGVVSATNEWKKFNDEVSALISNYQKFAVRELVQNAVDATPKRHFCVETGHVRVTSVSSKRPPIGSSFVSEEIAELLNWAQARLHDLIDLAEQKLEQFRKLFRLLRLFCVIQISCRLRKRHRRLINETDFSHDHSRFRLNFLIPVRVSLLASPEVTRDYIPRGVL